jgi:hypothetical protein
VNGSCSLRGNLPPEFPICIHTSQVSRIPRNPRASLRDAPRCWLSFGASISVTERPIANRRCLCCLVKFQRFSIVGRISQVYSGSLGRKLRSRLKGSKGAVRVPKYSVIYASYFIVITLVALLYSSASMCPQSARLYIVQLHYSQIHVRTVYGRVAHFRKSV